MGQCNDGRWRKNHRHSGLGRHLVFLVILKIVLLFGLWYTLIKPHKVKIDSDRAAAHIATPSNQINQGE